MWQWSLASTKCTTGFTREYLSLVSYYSWVEKVHDGNYSRAFSIRQLSLASSILSCRTSPTRAKFLEARIVTCIFCKLVCELYCTKLQNICNYILLVYLFKHRNVLSKFANYKVDNWLSVFINSSLKWGFLISMTLIIILHNDVITVNHNICIYNET